MEGEKTAAVLCPGPSLEATFGVVSQGYDAVIGVNRAVGRFECGYWSMFDVHTYDMVKPLGCPAIFTDATHFNNLLRAHPEATRHRLIVPQDIQLERRGCKWHTWSATAAIALAHHLGAREVDIYGMDWSGIKDFDGFTDQRQVRTEERWARERSCLEQLQVMLAGLGTTVRRIRGEPRGSSPCSV